MVLVAPTSQLVNQCLENILQYRVTAHQKDSDSLPPYEILDAILEMYVHQDMGTEEIVSEGYDQDLVVQVARMVDRNEYKRRQAAPGVKITTKAFGKDRRLPITNAYVPGSR